MQALAKDLAVPEHAVVATVMKQILECLTVSGLPDTLAHMLHPRRRLHLTTPLF